MKITVSIAVLTFALTLFTRAEDALYTVKSAIQFKAEGVGDPEKLLTENLPRGDRSISLKQIPKSQVFEILVTGTDAKAAATRANQVALALQSLLNDPAGAAQPVTIFMKATAADAVAVAAGAVEKGADDFTPWMDKAGMDAFMKELDGDKPGGKNFWDRGHWIVAVEGRWHEGKPEHRIRYTETPKGKKSITWYWWLNANQEEWAGHVEKYADDGFTLVHWTTYQRPDGRAIYDGVWHKIVD